MTGLSPRNLEYRRAFAEAWPEEPIVQLLVAQIPWGHCVRLLDYVKTSAEREWYVRKTIERGCIGPSDQRVSRRPVGAGVPGAGRLPSRFFFGDLCQDQRALL
jgi:hypothetical protein